MTNRKLVFEDQSGKVVRSLAWNGQDVTAIRRRDSRRIEFHESTANLVQSRVRFDELAQIPSKMIGSEKAVAVGEFGHLRLVSAVDATIMNEPVRKESNKLWYAIILLIFLIQGSMVGILLSQPREIAKIDEELKQQVVKIVKKIPPKVQPVAVSQNKSEQKQPVTAKVVKQRADTIKRLGALGVLGSLSKSNQKGGLDLGAVNTTAGPGLGGNAGSGGVQTTLYGKGLVGAPLGVGGNMQGGGGYGTKGKGGGQAGYGKMSLIGSSGGSAIPLGKEAIVSGGGLDMDLVADVIAKNMGQVRFCYEQGLQMEPSLKGRVSISWTIGAQGQVKSAEVATTSLNSKQVEDCILLRLRTWKFPLPDGGKEVSVNFPFMLNRAGQG